jgi:uncharacterized protein (DUF488 family)
VDLWTVGHSTRTSEVFVSLLQAHRIETVADVRRYPASRRHPQFNHEQLAATLSTLSVDYVPMPDLGGRRSTRRNSHNTVWRDPSFRGYADYMETPAFEAALETLVALATTTRTAIMCAEAVWWQCHRQMIADALKARAIRVLHIHDESRVTEHAFTSAARIVDGRLQYGHATDALHQFWDNA